MVYNAELDLTSQGGVATDILKKIPQVDVDVHGNVELQGSANIRFLINGKPSVIFGNNIADVLKSDPASQIQSIEIITNPAQSMMQKEQEASSTSFLKKRLPKESMVVYQHQAARGWRMVLSI